MTLKLTKENHKRKQSIMNKTTVRLSATGFQDSSITSYFDPGIVPANGQAQQQGFSELFHGQIDSVQIKLSSKNIYTEIKSKAKLKPMCMPRQKSQHRKHADLTRQTIK